MVDITYRNAGPWGAGKGANLLPAEVDDNFYSLAQGIVDLETNPAVPVGIASITMSGTSMTIHLTDGSSMGPFLIPVLTFAWRGEWQPSTSYAELDVVTVEHTGIFMAAVAHTSGTEFDPNLMTGSPAAAAWLQLFGSVDGSLSGLSDVLILGGSPAQDDVLIWQANDQKWENIHLGSIAFQEANGVNITGGLITGLPTPVNDSDAVTKAYADALPGGMSADDASMMANISGIVAPATPHTLTDYLDYVIGSDRGNIIYRGGSGWVALPPGVSGQFLKTLGAGADPQWAAGGAGVTQIDAGIGISVGGSPLVSTGTISLADIADDRLLANISGSTAAPTPTTLSALLDSILTNARGTVITRTGAGWVGLAPGTNGYYLKTQGAGADVLWDAPAGSGTVTSIDAGTGISVGGSPITGVGTVSLATIANQRVMANISGGTAAPSANTLSGIIDNIISSTQGVILYRNNTAWVALSPGTAGQVLTTGGAAANPGWSNVPAAAAIGNNLVLANISGGSPATPTGNSISDILDSSLGSTRGMVLFRGASGWQTLSPGTSGYVLTTAGAGANPSWTAPSAAAAIANNTVSANVSGSPASPSGTTITALLDATLGSSRGMIIHRNASSWVALAPGTNGQVLTTRGGAANVQWSNPGSTGGGGGVAGPGTGSPPVSVTDNDIVLWDGSSGAAIKDSGVTIASLRPSGSANTPLFNNGSSGFTNGTRSGNTTQVATVSGSPPTSTHLAVWDASGNLIDGGAVPTGGVAPSGSANTPLFDNGSGGFTNGTRHGNTTEVATTTGSTTNTHLAVWDANGNLIDGGAPSSGTGDVTGPGSATDDHVATFDGTTGKLIQDGGVAITDLLVNGGALGTPSSGSAINLTNIPVNNATGVLGTTHGGAGAVNGILKANGAGTVSQATVGTDYAAAPTGSANTPLFNNGSGGFTNGTRTGNSTLVATASGSVSSGHIATWDGNGNLIDGGSLPGGSSGTAGVAQIDTYTSGTNSWSKPTGAKVVVVILYGGGGGGGAGVGAAAGNTRAPGTGGGGGACVIRTFQASDIATGSPATETVVVGAGGAGGTTSGAVGQAGGNTTFGSFMTAFGGGRGNGNVAGAMTGGGGGGSGSVGSNGATSAVSGGLPTTTGTVVGVSGGGGGGAGTGGMSAEWGGGGGGAASAGQAGTAGGASLYGGGGGGGGGGITSGNSNQVSADGGGVGTMSANAAAGGGGANGGNNTGNPGSPGNDGNTTRGGTGGGGGSCNTAGTGGKGGNGGACGGGGGGGGGGTSTQGNGGDGGNGRAYVITYF